MTISVSTVTPVYRGEKYLEELVNRIAKLREKWQLENSPLELQEAIFVIDDAVDDSYFVLDSLTKQFCWIKVINLSRNFGQHAATVAGICHTASDWVVTLDEDLQHDPIEIDCLFYKQSFNSSDLIYALPDSAAHGNSWRDTSSRLTKTLLAKLTGVPQIKSFNSFRLIRGSIARAAASSSTSQTYLDIALTWFTKSFDVTFINMQDERYITTKTSGYTLIKLVNHARKLIVSSHLDVASFGLMIGGIAILIAILIAIFALSQKLIFPETVNISGWASTMVVTTFLSGIIISLLCIALEYINIIAINQLGKPTFFTINRENDKELVAWYQK